MTITYENAYNFYKFQGVPDEEIDAWALAAVKRGQLLSNDLMDLLNEAYGKLKSAPPTPKNNSRSKFLYLEDFSKKA